MKAQAIKLKGETMEKLKGLNIETGGVELSSYDAKITHLIWFYNEHNKNN